MREVFLAGGKVDRLIDVTLDIRPGVTAVAGPSGAGKTSLLNLLVGFDRPTLGNVTASPSGGGFALPLFWLPQGEGLWPHLTVRRHLLAVSDDAEAADELLARFDLTERASFHPDRLSQGERGRLGVARALAARAAVLVMDEPLVHVDPSRLERYWDVVREHLRETGASLVFSTHAPERVLTEARRVVIMRDGALLFEGPVDDAYWRPPSQNVAAALGPCNFLTAAEARLWLKQVRRDSVCYRPEQLRVEPASEGDAPWLRVDAARFAGAVEEVTLVHEEAGAKRRFYHRPSSPNLLPGVRVLLRTCLLVLLALALAGCDAAQEPALPVRAVRHVAMPPDGVKSPAPRGVAIGAGGEVLTVDTSGRIVVFGPDGVPRRQWFMPEVSVGKPESLLVLRDGRIAVPDTHYHRVVIFDGDGNVLRMFGSHGTGPGQFIYPVSVAEDEAGHLYVCEYGSNDRVQKFAADGAYVSQFGTFGTGADQLQRPSGIVWHDGKVYVADAVNGRVQVFTDGGAYVGALGDAGAAGEPSSPELRLPYDIALGADASLYVVEYSGGRVTKLGLDGRLLGRYGSSGTGQGHFATPWGIAVDEAGDVWVADTGNRRLVELSF